MAAYANVMRSRCLIRAISKVIELFRVDDIRVGANAPKFLGDIHVGTTSIVRGVVESGSEKVRRRETPDLSIDFRRNSIGSRKTILLRRCL